MNCLKQSKFLCFNEALLTDIGRAKVRKYLKPTDVQAVWKEYSEYMTTSSKGASEKRKLTHYVTNTVLDSQFDGSTQVAFLMCTLEIPQKIAAQVLCS